MVSKGPRKVMDAKELPRENKFMKEEDHNELLNIHLDTDIPGSDIP